MNIDLYNYHTRASSTRPTSALSDPSIHFASHIHFCCSWNDGTCWWSYGQCQNVTVSAASNVKEITHASTVPFGLPSPIASTLGQWDLWGASTFGAEDCLSTATHQIPIVNSVHSSRSFTSNGFTSNDFVPGTALDAVSVPVSVHVDIVSFAQDILGGGKSLIPFIPPFLLNLSSIPSPLRQDLVPPSSVSPIDAEKLWWELSSHPNQPNELCSFGSLMWFSCGL